MAIDLEAIRRKLGQLTGQSSSKNAYWRPEPDNEYTIRIIPFRNNDGQPFKERYFYYNIGNNRGLLTPSQFGKPDPIQELINKLRDEGTEASKELAKKLYPKMRIYAAVVVRGEEDKGPRLWSFGKQIYQQLLTIMLDDDYGDITDPVEGRDIKLTVSKPPGAQWAKTEILPRGKSSRLSTDKDQVEKWLSGIPDLDELFQLKSYEELEKIINDWLNGVDDESTGTERGGTQTNTSEFTKKTYKSVPSRTSNDEESHDFSASAFDDIDDAFKALTSDD